MGFAIMGMGTALPKYAIPQALALAVARQFTGADEKQSRVLQTLYRRSGVAQRHSVIAEEGGGVPVFYSPVNATSAAVERGPTTRQRMERYAGCVGGLAIEAAREALENSKIAAREITHLITASCTGFYSPGVDAALIEALQLPRTVGRANIGFMGCHAALNALGVALSTAKAYREARILVCAAELCTLHFQYGWDPAMIVPNALFADGAAAVVGQFSPGCEGWRVRSCASCLLPESQRDMTWKIGDHGFEMYLSNRVSALVGRHLPAFLSEWLGREGMKMGDVGSWAVHPGGPGILDAVRESLHLPEGALAVSHGVLEECGNMSSPTVLFILERLRKFHAPRPCVMLAFGPGLVAEAALVV